jgi:hypothetical protein
MRKLDRIVELAAELAAARATVTRLEEQLEQLIGEGGAPVVDRRAIIAARAGAAAPTAGKVKRGERLAQVVAAVKAGKGARGHRRRPQGHHPGGQRRHRARPRQGHAPKSTEPEVTAAPAPSPPAVVEPQPAPVALPAEPSPAADPIEVELAAMRPDTASAVRQLMAHKGKVSALAQSTGRHVQFWYQLMSRIGTNPKFPRVAEALELRREGLTQADVTPCIACGLRGHEAGDLERCPVRDGRSLGIGQSPFMGGG